jgi:uncharacterized protein YecE (DUF72 family)
VNPRPTSSDDRDFFEPANPQDPGGVAAAAHSEDVRRLGHLLPKSIFLGTSSWSFPGWNGIVYGGSFTESQLARAGLAAYAMHPVLRTVGIDRSFYQPLGATTYSNYAAQVPESFRFVTKAPAEITDAVLRGEHGVADAPNPHFLDAKRALDRFVGPAMEGLGAKAGPLVFQFSPIPRDVLQPGDAVHALIDRIGAFIEALPKSAGGIAPTYAVELRNAELLTPRLVRVLRQAGARLCLSVHARMPEAARQSAALRTMDGAPEEGDEWRLKGPLVVSWNLHVGLRYEEAKRRYAPFDRLLDADILTRGTLAHLIHVALRSGQPAFVIANNKAEGCAPASCVELARAVVAR